MSEPEAIDNARVIPGEKVDYAKSAGDAISDAELVFILTEWSEFDNPALYTGKKVFYGRRFLNTNKLNNEDYEGICW